ncbi:unnamed protein product, partial [Scytosiphon promiscuus]
STSTSSSRTTTSRCTSNNTSQGTIGSKAICGSSASTSQAIPPGYERQNHAVTSGGGGVSAICPVPGSATPASTAAAVAPFTSSGSPASAATPMGGNTASAGGATGRHSSASLLLSKARGEEMDDFACRGTAASNGELRSGSPAASESHPTITTNESNASGLDVNPFARPASSQPAIAVGSGGSDPALTSEGGDGGGDGASAGAIAGRDDQGPSDTNRGVAEAEATVTTMDASTASSAVGVGPSARAGGATSSAAEGNEREGQQPRQHRREGEDAYPRRAEVHHHNNRHLVEHSRGWGGHTQRHLHEQRRQQLHENLGDGEQGLQARAWQQIRQQQEEVWKQEQQKMKHCGRQPHHPQPLQPPRSPQNPLPERSQHPLPPPPPQQQQHEQELSFHGHGEDLFRQELRRRQQQQQQQQPQRVQHHSGFVDVVDLTSELDPSQQARLPPQELTTKNQSSPLGDPQNTTCHGDGGGGGCGARPRPDGVLSVQGQLDRAMRALRKVCSSARQEVSGNRQTIQYLEQKLEEVSAELLRVKSSPNVVYIDNGAAAVAAALSPSLHHPSLAAPPLPDAVRPPPRLEGNVRTPQTGTYCRDCCPIGKAEQQQPAAAPAVAPASSVPPLPAVAAAPVASSAAPPAPRSPGVMPPEVAIGLAATVAAAAAAEKRGNSRERQQEPQGKEAEGAEAKAGGQDGGPRLDPAVTGCAGAARFHAPPPALPAVPAAQRAAAFDKHKANEFPHQLTAAAAVAAAQPVPGPSEEEQEEQGQQRQQGDGSLPVGRSARADSHQPAADPIDLRAAPAGDMATLAEAAAAAAPSGPEPGVVRTKSSSDNDSAGGRHAHQLLETWMPSLSDPRPGSAVVDGGDGCAGGANDYFGGSASIERLHPESARLRKQREDNAALERETKRARYVEAEHEQTIGRLSDEIARKAEENASLLAALNSAVKTMAERLVVKEAELEQARSELTAARHQQHQQHQHHQHHQHHHQNHRRHE